MGRSSGVYKRCSCRSRVDGRLLGLRCPRMGERGHGSWFFTLELPAGRDGRRQRVRRGGFGSRVAAGQAREFLLGGDVDPDRSVVTVGQWLDVWMEMRSPLMSFSTRRLYAQHIHDYLKPHLGRVPLRDLTIGKTQAMFTSRMRTRAAVGELPLSGATLQRIRGVLRAALNGAIRRGLIEQNPARWVELPSGRRSRAVVWTEPRVAQWRATGERSRVAVWTVPQTITFLAAIRNHPLYVLYLLVTLLGLRRGEAAGLRWCDFDLDARVVTVSHQAQDHNGRTVICPPKTPGSVRAIALDHYLVAAVRQLRAVRLAGLPPGAVLTGFLFTNRHGNPLSPGYLTHTFRRLVDQANLPPIRLHDLRHGAASLSLAAGNDLKVVQELLRHASIVLTADTYTSVLPCLAHRAAEATAELVLGAPHPVRRAGRRPRRGSAGHPARQAAGRRRTTASVRADASGTTRSVAV